MCIRDSPLMCSDHLAVYVHLDLDRVRSAKFPRGNVAISDRSEAEPRIRLPRRWAEERYEAALEAASVAVA
eukprot:10108807-Alexandrium_andersonii.AAC.1